MAPATRGSSVMTMESTDGAQVQHARKSHPARARASALKSSGSASKIEASASKPKTRFAGRAPQRVAEVPEDGGTKQKLSVEPSLTSKNSPEHRKEQIEQNEKEDGEDDRKSSPSINDRLLQARNYLTNETYESDPQFDKRNLVIDKLLRRAAKSKEPYDKEVYDDLQHMSCIPIPEGDGRSAKTGIHPSKAGDGNLPQLRGAPLREDDSPFTIERPEDQDAFREALRAHDSRGKLLRKVERNAYSEALEDPTRIQEVLEEDEEQTQDERFHARAMSRGRKRAAMQMTLHSNATNHEQHFEGGWEHRVLPLPEPIGQGLAMAADGEESPANGEPVVRRKKVSAYQKPVKKPRQTRTTKPASQARGILKATPDAHLASLASRLFDAIYDFDYAVSWDEPDETDIRYINYFFTERIDKSGLPTPSSRKDRIREVLDFCEEHDWFEVESERVFTGKPEPGSKLIGLLAETRYHYQEIQVDGYDGAPYTPGQRYPKEKNKARAIAPLSAEQRKINKKLQELAMPLNGDNGVPSLDEAIELLTDRLLRQNSEAAQEPAFLNRRPGPQPKPSAVALGKRKAHSPIPVPASEAARKRRHRSSPPDDSASMSPSEGSRSSTPELGQGALMPAEMQAFDVRRHGNALENARDGKEKAWPGSGRGQGGFMFAETGFLAGVATARVGRDLREGALDRDPSDGSGGGAKGEKLDTEEVLREVPRHMPAAMFPLPRADDEGDSPC